MKELTKKERVKKYGEVFTPQHIVNQMCDSLEYEAPDCYAIGKTFLEPCCGEGVFVLEILRRKFSRCQKRSDYTEVLRSVWAMDIQERNVTATIENIVNLCGEYFSLTREETDVISNHVILCDSLKVMRMMNELNEKERESETQD